MSTPWRLAAWMMVSSERAVTACPLRLNSTSVGSCCSSKAVIRRAPLFMSVQRGVVMRPGLLQRVPLEHAIDLGLSVDPLLHDVSRIEVLALRAVVRLDGDHVVAIFRGHCNFLAFAERGRDSAAIPTARVPLLIGALRIGVLERKQSFLHVVSGGI